MEITRVEPYVPAATPKSPRACRMAGEIGLLAADMWKCVRPGRTCEVTHRCPSLSQVVNGRPAWAGAGSGLGVGCFSDAPFLCSARQRRRRLAPCWH